MNLGNRDRAPRTAEETDRMIIRFLPFLLVAAGLGVMAQFALVEWEFIEEAAGGSVAMELIIIPLSNLNSVFYIIGGVLLYRVRDTVQMYRVAAGIAILIGIHMFHLSPVDPELSLLDYYLDVTSDILILGMLLFGILLWIGRMKYARVLGYIAMFNLAYEIITYRYNAFLMPSTEQILLYLVPFLPYTALKFVHVGIMFRPSVMPESLVKRMTGSGSRIVDTGYTDSEAYMVRSDLIGLAGLFDAPAEEGDPDLDIERRYSIVSPLRTRTMTVRRWKGEDFLRATMGSDSGSFDGFRFQIRQIVPDTGSLDDCGSVQIFGETGMMVNIMIRDRVLTFQELSALEYDAERERRGSSEIPESL